MNVSFRPQNIPPLEQPVQIVLASQSIGRRTLLEKLGIRFRTLVTNVDEDAILDKDPIKTIKKRANAKVDDVIKNARAYLISDQCKSLVIAADSMAVLGKQTFGKSLSKEESKEMIKKLMGKTHIFVTALSCVLTHGHTVKKRWESVTKTKVSLRKLSGPELDSYIARYDFSRFAAAYTINEAPWDLVTKIDGSYTNVIGLPFEALLPILRKVEIII